MGKGKYNRGGKLATKDRANARRAHKKKALVAPEVPEALAPEVMEATHSTDLLLADSLVPILAAEVASLVKWIPLGFISALDRQDIPAAPLKLRIEGPEFRNAFCPIATTEAHFPLLFKPPVKPEKSGTNAEWQRRQLHNCIVNMANYLSPRREERQLRGLLAVSVIAAHDKFHGQSPWKEYPANVNVTGSCLVGGVLPDSGVDLMIETTSPVESLEYLKAFHTWLSTNKPPLLKNHNEQVEFITKKDHELINLRTGHAEWCINVYCNLSMKPLHRLRDVVIAFDSGSALLSLAKCWMRTHTIYTGYHMTMLMIGLMARLGKLANPERSTYHFLSNFHAIFAECHKKSPKKVMASTGKIVDALDVLLDQHELTLPDETFAKLLVDIPAVFKHQQARAQHVEMLRENLPRLRKALLEYVTGLPLVETLLQDDPYLMNLAFYETPTITVMQRPSPLPQPKKPRNVPKENIPVAARAAKPSTFLPVRPQEQKQPSVSRSRAEALCFASVENCRQNKPKANQEKSSPSVLPGDNGHAKDDGQDGSSCCSPASEQSSAPASHSHVSSRRDRSYRSWSRSRSRSRSRSPWHGRHLRNRNRNDSRSRSRSRSRSHYHSRSHNRKLSPSGPRNQEDRSTRRRLSARSRSHSRTRDRSITRRLGRPRRGPSPSRGGEQGYNRSSHSWRASSPPRYTRYRPLDRWR
ncbi:hypothetical protein DFS34DRAFT_623253 [Phlyctochytrium arcticum]|nr:hypothetical protein DFS34DRAFT_623253 [Phlyctochytrium arcticum]